MMSSRRSLFGLSSWTAFLKSHPTTPLDPTAIAVVTPVFNHGAHTAKTMGDTTSSPPMSRGHTLDSHLRRRLVRGDFVKDAILDLHGFREDEAFSFLCHRLPSLYHADKRFILVITGRGLHSHDGRAVLRERFVDWINLDPLAPYVLSYCEATARDGGAGAFYVLLRRRRCMSS